MLGNALTRVIGAVARAKGPNSKARAGGAAGAILTAGEPAINIAWQAVEAVFSALTTGLGAGLLPSIEQVGLVAGQALGGWIVGYAITWFAAKNEDG